MCGLRLNLVATPVDPASGERHLPGSTDAHGQRDADTWNRRPHRCAAHGNTDTCTPTPLPFPAGTAYGAAGGHASRMADLEQLRSGHDCHEPELLWQHHRPGAGRARCCGSRPTTRTSARTSWWPTRSSQGYVSQRLVNGSTDLARTLLSNGIPGAGGNLARRWARRRHGPLSPAGRLRRCVADVDGLRLV